MNVVRWASGGSMWKRFDVGQVVPYVGRQGGQSDLRGPSGAPDDVGCQSVDVFAEAHATARGDLYVLLRLVPVCRGDPRRAKA